MEPDNVIFSIDLVEAALRHMDFLDRVTAVQSALVGPALKHALRRYEQLWLPLADRNREHDLAAPIDVEWFWYIHMLSPLAYRRDCRKLLSNTLGHEFPHEDRMVSRTNTAIELWYAQYKLDGFNIIRNGGYTRPVRNKGELEEMPSRLSVDLLANSVHHTHFCYQVSLPHFRDRKYLQSAVRRYKQFLCLKRMEPDEFLTPSVDIMLIWFTHMCHPFAYAKDLLHNVGQVLDNNVKIRPTLVTEQFLAARKKTDALWQRHASTTLLQPGSKLRSNLNTRDIASMTTEDLAKCCDVMYRIHFRHAELTSKPRRVRKFEVKVFLSGSDTSEASDIVTLEGPRRLWSLSSSFHFNSAEHTGLEAKLYLLNRFWCMHGEQTIASGSFDMLKFLQDPVSAEKSAPIEIDMQDDLKLILEMSAPTAMPHLCTLELQGGDFEQQTLGIKEIRRILGSLSIPGEEATIGEQTCFVGNSRLLNKKGLECFRCRVIHIPALLCSGVQVFYGNKLVATADVIGSSHLPTSTQLEGTDASMAFDPELGERAVLIRNNKGDWGICVARWTTDNAGFLDVRFMRLSGSVKKIVSLELTATEVEFQSFTTNLYTGEIFINPASNAVGENLALIWSISVLYVLCAPRKHRDLTLSMSFTAPIRNAFSSKVDLEDDAKEEEDNMMQVQEADCPLLLAAGLGTHAPTNAYILNKYGSLKYDINLNAQDMVVEEQVVDKKLFRKESKEIRGEFSDSPRKAKKKRKMKNRDSSASLLQTGDSLQFNQSLSDSLQLNQSLTIKEVDAPPASTKPKSNQVAPYIPGPSGGEGEPDQQKDEPKKRKRLKKKRSTKLDDMLPLSDDSITKDDVVEKKLVKDKQGKTIAVPRISDLKDDMVPLSDDSVEQELKEIEEFQQNEFQQNVGTLETPDIVREGTSVIREIAAKRKHKTSESGSATNVPIPTETGKPKAPEKTESVDSGTESKDDNLEKGEGNVGQVLVVSVPQNDQGESKSTDNPSGEVQFYLDEDKNAGPTTVET